jgi:cytochrome c peroxidase
LKQSIFPYSFILVLFLAACGKNESSFKPSEQDLVSLLESRSPNGSLGGLMLPASYNYSLIPQDNRNEITKHKVELGRLLYNETALSINPKNVINYGTYSCASCHHSAAGFQSGLRQGIGEGGEGFGMKGEGRARNKQCADKEVDVQPLKSPSTLNIAYQTNVLWNGQFGANGLNIGTESQWTIGTPKAVNHLGYEGVETQAIAGFEVHRMGTNVDLLKTEPYKSYFKKAFPEYGSIETLANKKVIELIGLAIAAYERTLISDLAPYQQWLKGSDNALTENQKEGMRLFFDKAQCFTCHNGPALSSMEFYVLGFGDLRGPEILGENNLAANLGRGDFTKKEQDNYKFKVPQLYNLQDAKFYGHGATLTSIEQVVQYFNKAESENDNVPNDKLAKEFKPLNLSDVEVEQLVDFLTNGLYDSELQRYDPTFLPSGNCFPDNDPISKKQLCE